MKGNKANTFAACQRSLLALSPLKTGDNVQEKMRQPCVRMQQRRINLCKSQAQQRQASFSLPLLVTFSLISFLSLFFLSDNRSALLARLKSIPNGTLQYCIIPKWPSKCETTQSASMGWMVFHIMWFSHDVFLQTSLSVSISPKTARHNAGWRKMRIIVISAGTTSLPCFSLWVFLISGQLACWRSAARLVDSLVGVSVHLNLLFYLCLLCFLWQLILKTLAVWTSDRLGKKKNG